MQQIIQKKKHLPTRISIGVCAYNEEKNIGLLLKNLLTQQDLPLNCEIIVACSGCTDSTPDVVRKFQEQDARVKLITEEERRGKAQALNYVFKHASASEALVLTNADAFPDAGSIMKLVKMLEKSDSGAVAGQPVPINELGSLPDRVVRLIWDLHHKVSAHQSVKLSGELCAFRPFLVKEIPTNLATDEPYIEMLIRRQGYDIAYCPEALVYIRGPRSIREIIKHRKRIWTGHLQIQKTEGFVVSTSDFKKIMSTLIKSVKPRLGDLSTLGLFIVLELYAYMLARFDFSRGKIPFMWEMLKSTKD